MPSSPVLTAGAWRGPELQSRTEQWIYELTDQERDQLRYATASVRDRQIPLHRISPREFQLPTFGPLLRRVARDISEGPGFVLLRGFPTEGLSTEEIATLYFGALTHVGIPIAQSSRNDLIGDVRDEGSTTAATRGYQTNRALGYHSDSADLVSLFCVQPAASGGLSKIMSAVAVHNIIQTQRPDLLAVLYEEPFYCSWSGQEPKGQLPFYWTHFFSWYGGRLHTSGIKEKYVDWPPMSPVQQEAIEFVRSVLQCHEDELALAMDFRPGDVQILDNSIVWHSRTGFVDHTDPRKRRHLLRVWLNYYAERPVAPDFWNRHEMVDQLTSSPKRRLFDVDVFDTW
jgi:Taurine catabolism dioxygenase TauD, TfdA family